MVDGRPAAEQGHGIMMEGGASLSPPALPASEAEEDVVFIRMRGDDTADDEALDVCG